MKILIAGGAGYRGSKIIPHLIEHGYEIDVIDLLAEYSLRSMWFTLLDKN